MGYLTDEEREHFRAELAPIVGRVAREMHEQYRRVVPDAPEWAADSEQAQALRMHWTRMAWEAVTGSIARRYWPSSQAER
jgi:protoheme ferro-lyase